MIKTHAANITDSNLSERIITLLKRLIKAIMMFRPITVLSEDMQYKLYFIREYMPKLYWQHTIRNHVNCIFCANLVKSRCHRHCLKCASGTYIKCGPPLPGAIFGEAPVVDEGDRLSIPWYYRKPCEDFRRLRPDNYCKNLYPILSTICIYHYEVLEGLENGLSWGMKPCHVCASVNYDVYKKCTSQQGFDVSTPCYRITDVLHDIYRNDAV